MSEGDFIHRREDSTAIVTYGTARTGDLVACCWDGPEYLEPADDGLRGIFLGTVPMSEMNRMSDDSWGCDAYAVATLDGRIEYFPITGSWYFRIYARLEDACDVS